MRDERDRTWIPYLAPPGTRPVTQADYGDDRDMGFKRRKIEADRKAMAEAAASARRAIDGHSPASPMKCAKSKDTGHA